jgi:hypothetical protein
MRLPLVFLFSLLATFCFSQIDYKIEPTLQEAMINSSDYIPIFVSLKAQTDFDALEKSFKNKRVSKKERARIVIQEQISVAEQTQPQVVGKIKNLASEIKLESLERFWISNVIRLEAKSGAIAKISEWEEIEFLFMEPQLETGLIEKGEALPPSFIPNGREPGITAIKANKLWEMGYTGYGTKALIIDSGQELRHHGIRQQYAGNFLPLSQVWDAGFSEPFDVDGHGTHVTGTICGLNRLTRDTFGVAYNAHWMGSAVQFSNAEQQPHPVSNFLRAKQFALNPDGNPNTTDDIPDVINNSWSSGSLLLCSGSSAFDVAIRALETAGVAIVWSSGNAGPEESTLRGYQNSNRDLLSGFAVGATNANSPYNIANFSSRGPSLCGGLGALAIKPEVSAPGMQIRSSTVGNSFVRLNGTSMASPHVSGAVLLLKEAFPDATGLEILGALYNSAIDLGPPGEDNIYGKGLIDVYAAFNLMLENGFQAVPPANKENDIILIDVEASRTQFCLGDISFKLLIFNNMKTELNELELHCSIGNQEYTQKWVGSIAPLSAAYIDFQNITLINPGDIDFHIYIDKPNGKTDDRPLNNQWLRRFRVENINYLEVETDVSPGDEICKNTQFLLSAPDPGIEGTSNYWFPTNTSNSVLATGNNFLTPVLENDAFFYLDRLSQASVGKQVPVEENAPFKNQLGDGLVFDAVVDILIQHVSIYAINTGPLIVSIIDEAGSQVGTVIYTVERAGRQQVPINISIPRGNNYEILLSSNRRLVFSESEVDFPYNVNGMISIKRSVSRLPNLSFSEYNYFYDWSVSAFNPCGRTEVPIVINTDLDAPQVSFVIEKEDSIVQPGDIIEFNPDVDFENIVEYRWDFGDGSSSFEINPTHSYSEDMNAIIYLTVKADNGCINTFAKELEIKTISSTSEESVSDDIVLKMFPNPATETLFYSLTGPENRITRIEVLNQLAQVVYGVNSEMQTINQEGSLPLGNLTPGLYILSINTEFGQIAKKFIKK